MNFVELIEFVWGGGCFCVYCVWNPFEKAVSEDSFTVWAGFG